jgi:hypothetical protein
MVPATKTTRKSTVTEVRAPIDQAAEDISPQMVRPEQMTRKAWGRERQGWIGLNRVIGRQHGCKERTDHGDRQDEQ